MATTKTGYPTIGTAWAAAMALWVQFANGDFTSWSYTLTTLSTYYAIKITVGLSGGGSDDYYLGAMDTFSDDKCTLRQIFTSTGWRSMPQVVLPPTVPGGDDADVSWLNGPRALRRDIVEGWSNSNTGTLTDRSVSGPDGVTNFSVAFWCWRQNIVFVDVTGIMFGTLSGVDAFAAAPTDYIGDSPIVAIGGGGGSVDLGPVVDALEDIATMDVEYQFNNGGAGWSLRGKVRTP